MNCRSFYVILWSRKKQAKTAAGLRLQFKLLREKNTSPKKYKKWTDIDKGHLLESMNENISIDETALGIARAKLRKKQEGEIKSIARQLGREVLLNIINGTGSESPSNSSVSNLPALTPVNLCGRMESI